MTVVAGAAQAETGIPVATSALKRRAPSRWTGRSPDAAITAPNRSIDHGAPEAAMWVFSRQTSETAGWWYADAARGPRDGVGRDHPVGVIHGVELHTRIARRRAVLVGHQVVARPGHHGGSGRGQEPHGNLVGHGPRGDEECGRLADALGERLLQRAHGGIFPVVVVAHLGVGHGAPHGRCRSGDRVTAQIDQVGHAFTLTGAPVTSRRVPCSRPHRTIVGRSRVVVTTFTSSSTSRCSKPSRPGSSSACR